MNSSFNNTASQGKAQPFDLDKLKVQQRILGKQGKMHGTHWLIVALSVFITVFAWKTSQSAMESQEQFRFDREAERVVNLMQERIKHYEDALLSGVAAMQTHEGKMSHDQWRRYAGYLELTERYPGINGIGVIHYVETEDKPDFLSEVRVDYPDFVIHPEHPYDLSLPITYIEPERSNAAAVGLDVAFEANRRSAALAARATGNTQISGPIVLVQDDSKTPGFLFYAPYYDRPHITNSPWTDAQREENFRGLIYAPLVMKTLVEGVLSANNRHVSLSIRDGESILYEELPASDAELFTSSEDISMNGRTWSFDIVSQPSLGGIASTEQPTFVLLSGLSLDAMLFGLFWLMSRSNRSILSMAESMTSSLADQARKLSDNNRDLESFAHVVSHDLKTPMRNIHSVVGILDEDYGDYLASNDEGLEIKAHLSLLQDQATRGQSLISGILDYSRLGADADQSITVDTRRMIETIGQQLNLSQTQLSLSGKFPTLVTNETLLRQVLSNLIENAIKYNLNFDSATVAVSVGLRQGHYCFAVRDNGPGIEARFHERIFEPFNTLHLNVDIHSSGIGLSIVKRSLELQGGRIWLDSAPGKGSTFEFIWPIAQAYTDYNEQARVA